MYTFIESYFLNKTMGKPELSNNYRSRDSRAFNFNNYPVDLLKMIKEFESTSPFVAHGW